MSLGKFFAIEGGDGAGKTTFVNELKKACPDYVYSREPGGKGMSHLVRMLVLSEDARTSDPLTMFHLFWASRAENFASVVLPALKEGKTVISDRFDASTYAFQIGENPHLEDLFWKTRKVCLQGVEPVYLNFEVSIEKARSRMDRRGGQNHFDLRADEYRRSVRSQYQKFFGNPTVESVTIDADLPEDQMIARGMGALEKALSM